MNGVSLATGGLVSPTGVSLATAGLVLGLAGGAGSGGASVNAPEGLATFAHVATGRARARVQERKP